MEEVTKQKQSASHEVLNLIADRVSQTLQPSTQEDLNRFIRYLQSVREALTVDIPMGEEIGTSQVTNVAPLEILAQGHSAIEAYNRALIDGKAYIKRVPVMLIGQDRTGKTSLKRSLKGEAFNANERSTDGIETDPSYFRISTEIWRTGKKNEDTDSESKFLFEHYAAQHVVESLKKGKTNSPQVKETSVTEQTILQDPILRVTDSCEDNDDRLFARTLPQDVASLVGKLLQDDETVEDEDEMYSIFWDFGGQSVYYATHPIFLTEKAIYILVCDLSRNPNEKASVPVMKGMYWNIKDTCCNKTNLDYLDFWMSSVYSLVGANTGGQDAAVPGTLTEKLPPVFLVCSHADKPYRDDDPKQLALEVYGVLRKRIYYQHLFKDIFVVDNTKSGSDNECPEVVRLRRELFAVAENLPLMKEAIPLKWLRYENILQCLSKERYKWIPIQKARQIASDECGIRDEEEFRVMLNFLHEQRILVHFNETPELDNMVILDPQWLIDVFKRVITVKRYEHTEKNVEELWLQLETGILDERLLHHAWKPLFDSQEPRNSLIALMERFCLLCSWPSDNANKKYLVPSMLMSPPTDDVLEVLPSVQIPSLFVRFESGRVPVGLFSRLVLLFYQMSKTQWKSPVNPELFNNFALFHILPDQGTSVTLLCHSSCIEIVVRNGDDAPEEVAGFNHGNFDLTTSRVIHDQLKFLLECLRMEFHWLKNMVYEICVCCPVCSQKGSVQCRVHGVRGCECLHLLSEVELQKSQYCKTPGVRGDCRIDIKMFAPWFKFLDAQESGISLNEQKGKKRKMDFNEQEVTRCKMQPQDATGRDTDDKPCLSSKKVKGGSPSDEKLEELARKIGKGWKPLGRRLGFEETELTGFHKENEEYSEKSYQMLLKWKQKGGTSGATYEILNEALRHRLVNRVDLAEEFCCQ